MRFKILTLLLFFTAAGHSQNYDKNYFRSPVNIPVRLAGNFGEIRSNHFHSGIDIKVPFAGIPIYAPADGFISRIRKSADGYGNALYIDHSNKLRTVYGHLQKFTPDVENYVTGKQYEQKKYEITLYPDSAKFKIKKGQIIGYAGNSGRSYGPHLHFEIRTLSDTPLNPQLFNFNIKDNIKPRIFFVEAEPLNRNTTINGKKSKQKFKTIYKNGKYYIPGTIKIRGKAGISVNANDYINHVRNTQGIYKAEMFINDTLYFSYKFDKFDFSQSRYINSFIDYAEKQTSKKNFQRLWKEPGNYLNIYQKNTNNGILEFNDDKTRKIKIILTDCFKNSTELHFFIKNEKYDDKSSTHEANILFYDKDNYVIKPGFRATIKKGTLYKNIKPEFQTIKSSKYYSNIYKLNSYLIPAHKNIYYAVKPEKLPKKLIGKALIVNIDKNNKIHPLGGTYINGFIAGKCKCFGKFALTVDTIPPEIKNEQKYPQNNFSESKKISFKITDNLSGIKDYYAEIDNKFILFSYDKKNDRITYIFDNHITYNKKHKLKLTVTDKKNNKTVLNFTFFK